ARHRDPDPRAREATAFDAPLPPRAQRPQEPGEAVRGHPDTRVRLAIAAQAHEHPAFQADLILRGGLERPLPRDFVALPPPSALRARKGHAGPFRGSAPTREWPAACSTDVRSPSAEVSADQSRLR